jgi:predicted nucleic acid-binding Zn ribbon protein
MNCKFCGKDTNGRNIYCSKKCHREYWKRINKRFFKEKPCVICGKMFMPKATTNKYCSLKCKRIADIQRISKRPKIKDCLYCGKTFTPYTSLDKFCSANCRIQNKKQLRSYNWSEEKANKILGTGNPAYRNGYYTRTARKSTPGERVFIKNSKEIKQGMIDDVGYIYCEYCGVSNSIKYEAHHIIFRSERPRHINLHNKKNILIVCINCHNLLHKNKSLRDVIVNERNLHSLFNKKRIAICS